MYADGIGAETMTAGRSTVAFDHDTPGVAEGGVAEARTPPVGAGEATGTPPVVGTVVETTGAGAVDPHAASPAVAAASHATAIAQRSGARWSRPGRVGRRRTGDRVRDAGGASIVAPCYRAAR
jgi:hypothetical protein